MCVVSVVVGVNGRQHCKGYIVTTPIRDSVAIVVAVIDRPHFDVKVAVVREVDSRGRPSPVDRCVVCRSRVFPAGSIHVIDLIWPLTPTFEGVLQQLVVDDLDALLSDDLAGAVGGEEGVVALPYPPPARLDRLPVLRAERWVDGPLAQA